jgi:S1-C subfamily serine protease
MNHPSFAFLCINLITAVCRVSAGDTPQSEPQVQMINRIYMAVVNIQIDRGNGSGFFITTDGHIVTNAHVIRNASDITVVTQDGQSLKAKVIGQNRDVDIALIKVEPVRPPTIIPLTKESESPNMIGQTMVAIGNPLGVGTSVTRGILSGRGRATVVDGREFDNLLQTDASINPGNSGGPILDISGSLSGVTSIGTKGAHGLSYAIPVNIVRENVKEFMAKERK